MVMTTGALSETLAVLGVVSESLAFLGSRLGALGRQARVAGLGRALGHNGSLGPGRGLTVCVDRGDADVDLAAARDVIISQREVAEAVPEGRQGHAARRRRGRPVIRDERQGPLYHKLRCIRHVGFEVHEDRHTELVRAQQDEVLGRGVSMATP